ncbi:MAG: phosphatidylglycerophosphatase A [Acidobacteriota bacterium]|nr:phosphatidylglycerophosphatase A [Acidobacteriota bacterium]
MPVKESSDELNPPVIVAKSAVSKPRAARSAKDYLALAIATCGVGYLPLAPGTWGSLLALGGYMLLRRAWFPHTEIELTAYDTGFLLVQLLVIATVTLAGIWAASRTERVLQLKDPGKVVIDEVAGQLIALTAVPLTLVGPPTLVIVAFVLFRFFDIVKPYPARKLEALHGGMGIMMDDVVAGVYAAIAVMLVVSIQWFI